MLFARGPVWTLAIDYWGIMMKTKFATLATIAMLTTACSGASQAGAQSPEESVMFLLFGVHDKDAGQEASTSILVEKTSDTPLTLQIKLSQSGTSMNLMTMSVTKEDDCRYVTEITPGPEARAVPPVKARLDLKNLKAVTHIPAQQGVLLEGASMQCVGSGDECKNFERDRQGGFWPMHAGPLSAEAKQKHQDSLNETLKSFQTNVCKPS